MHELKPELLLNVRNAKQLSRPGVFETFLASDLDVTDLGAKAFSAYVRNNRGSPDRSSDRAGLTFKCWESEGISVTVRTIYPLTNFRRTICDHDWERRKGMKHNKRIPPGDAF